MECLKIISTLTDIAVALVVISQSGILFQRKKSLLSAKPVNITAQCHEVLDNTARQKSLFRKPWLIGLLLLLCMAYVLPEVFFTRRINPHGYI